MKILIKKFPDEVTLSKLIKSYFASIGNKQRRRISKKEISVSTNLKENTVDNTPEQPTITGLALYLGFNSLREFDEYENRGKHAHLIKRACLEIEVLYEKKLLQPSPNGAIFALKSRGG